MDGICPTPRLWLQLKGSRTSSKGPLAIIDQFGTPFCVFFGKYIKCIYIYTYVDIFVMYTTVFHLCQIFYCTAKEWVNQTFFQSTVEWIDHVVGTCLRGLGTLDSPWIILGS